MKTKFEKLIEYFENNGEKKEDKYGCTHIVYFYINDFYIRFYNGELLISKSNIRFRYYPKNIINCTCELFTSVELIFKNNEDEKEYYRIWNEVFKPFIDNLELKPYFKDLQN